MTKIGGLRLEQNFAKMAKQKKQAKQLKKARELKKAKALKNNDHILSEKIQVFDHFDELSEDSSDAFSKLSENEQEHFTEVI